MGENGQTPKKDYYRPRVVWEFSNPINEAVMRALEAKFPHFSRKQIVDAAMHNLLAFVYHGTEKISKREEMLILANFWPDKDEADEEDAP